jgi:hypothetical protein
MTDVAETVRTVAAFGLPGSTVDPPALIEQDEWPLTLAQLEHEKLTGIAVAAAEHGWLALKPEQLEALVARHRDVSAWCLGLERLVLDVADAFDLEGIGSLVLKGPAVARVAYPDPSWRPFGDIDLLVRTKDWRYAVAVLERDFGPRRIPEPRQGFDERFSKGAVFTCSGGQQIDLHMTLAQGPFGQWVQGAALFERSMPFTIGGKELRRANLSGMFLHACIHVMTGDAQPSLLSLRDVAQTGGSVEVDPAAVEDLARAWRAGVVVQRALARASDVLGWKTDRFEGLVRAPSDARAAAALRAYDTRRASRGAIVVETIRSISSVASKVAYLRALLFPKRSSLHSRLEPDHTSYVRRWIAPATWAIRDVIERNSRRRQRLHIRLTPDEKEGTWTSR